MIGELRGTRFQRWAKPMTLFFVTPSCSPICAVTMPSAHSPHSLVRNSSVTVPTRAGRPLGLPTNARGVASLQALLQNVFR